VKEVCGLLTQKQEVGIVVGASLDVGVIDWRILMAPDGKVAGVGIRKVP
jgi:hypothetical protein